MKYNIRTCIISKKKYSKFELLRFSIINNNVVINSNSGRGYYVYPSIKNYEILIKSKLLERKLGITIEEKQYLLWKDKFIY